MKTITLKDYFSKLDEYKNKIDEKINVIFNLESQQFTYDFINLLDARIGENNLFIKLEIVNYNGTDKNYLVEIFKIKNQIEQVIYVKKALGIGIDITKSKISSLIILELIKLLERHYEYFNNPYNKKNILSLFKASKSNNTQLDTMELEIEKLPSFIFENNEKKQEYNNKIY